MIILDLANQKGGVGKSAVGCQFAYYLAQLGKRVVFLDLDHQKNSTKAIIKSTRAAVADFTSSDVLCGQSRKLPDADFVIISGDDVLGRLERQPEEHNSFVNKLKAFMDAIADQFDVCVIDTNPNPDIRYAAALIVSDFVLSPVQLNQEAIDGIGSLLNHQRYGFHKIKAALNPTLELIGILPNMVEPTPFQRDNFKQLVMSFSQLLIETSENPKQFAFIPKRSAVAEAQAEGLFIGDYKKTAARDAWKEIKPPFDAIAQFMKLEV